METAICADATLGQIDIALVNAYREADATPGAARHNELTASEHAWLRHVQSSCPLGAAGGIPPVPGRACISSAFKIRIKQLQACPQEDDPIACLSVFAITEQ